MTENTPSAPDPNALMAALPADVAQHVQSAQVSGSRAIIVADVGNISKAGRTDLENQIKSILGEVPGITDVLVALTAPRTRRRIIAIGSGKGGVGKSTLTTNLAVAMAKAGHTVGVIDGDIYGPSQPKLLATENRKPAADEETKKLIPLDSPHGVKVLSMGHLVAPGKALAWRGPMAGKALGQMVDAEWGDTELLLIDLPPGTGDVQLSMMADSKPDGAILVSTPQDLALIDAARAGQLFEQGGVPIIGLVENMAGYACPHCGEISDPFGQGGVEKFADALEIPFWGRVPLAMEIRKSGDAGNPPAAGDTDEATPFHAVAEHLSRWLSSKQN
ncbi:Mrp/NBP35 family ATP-binding protein [Erythrobacter sp. YT30]|uniref:Mrp/NBP35 family ATP-binding protein n=1 Tax=Erythrobacter sp. YT30 TaxID=1735012 RepID=UPI00076D4A17|nr:Mrp/NBP35 family ATP-binding protein [Erythrobacter sp. YT30]KWV91718.1 chromosome partitioning protein ParA [Erythrobacter sp. YT30]